MNLKKFYYYLSLIALIRSVLVGRHHPAHVMGVGLVPYECQ